MIIMATVLSAGAMGIYQMPGLCRARDETQGFTHARLAFYQPSYILHPSANLLFAGNTSQIGEGPHGRIFYLSHPQDCR